MHGTHEHADTRSEVMVVGLWVNDVADDLTADACTE